MNAHADRFVRSIKHERLKRMVPLGENILRTVVRAYAAHDHHQGLDSGLVFPVQESRGARLIVSLRPGPAGYRPVGPPL